MSVFLRVLPKEWEEYPEAKKPSNPEGFFNPLTGKVYTPSIRGDFYMVEGHSSHATYLAAAGFVPVRRVKPAVPEWAEKLAWKCPAASAVNDIAEFLAENCVPKADADEMLAMLKDARNAFYARMQLFDYGSAEKVRAWDALLTAKGEVGISDHQRYKMLGNAVSVNVAEWIGQRIARYTHT